MPLNTHLHSHKAFLASFSTQSGFDEFYNIWYVFTTYAGM